MQSTAPSFPFHMEAIPELLSHCHRRGMPGLRAAARPVLISRRDLSFSDPFRPLHLSRFGGRSFYWYMEIMSIHFLALCAAPRRRSFRPGEQAESTAMRMGEFL